MVIDPSMSYPVTKHFRVFLLANNLLDKDYLADAFGGLHGASRPIVGGVWGRGAGLPRYPAVHQGGSTSIRRQSVSSDCRISRSGAASLYPALHILPWLDGSREWAAGGRAASTTR